MKKPATKLLLVLLLGATVARSQARINKDGRPILVMDDSMIWMPPTLIYKFQNEEFYVPDIDGNDWIRSRYQQFAASSAFSIFVYVYRTDTHGLHGQNVDVNLEKKTASIHYFATPHSDPAVVSLSNSSIPLVQALNLEIIPRVKRELMAYHRQLFDPHSPVDSIGTYSSATH